MEETDKATGTQADTAGAKKTVKKTSAPAKSRPTAKTSIPKTAEATKAPVVKTDTQPTEPVPATPVVTPAEPVQTPAATAEPSDPSVSDADSKNIIMKPPIVVKDLAARMNLKPFLLISHLNDMNIFSSITSVLEVEVARKLCEKHGFSFNTEKRDSEAGFHKPKVEPVAPPKVEKPKDDQMLGRPPVITFMGHVDHGKTSLMDAIRQSNVVSGEAGGITQHIGAYSLERRGQRITFLDTPGHAAFSAMRARGANVTDIVVLVVAANDGFMPQTEEALAHAKAAPHVRIMVAINKCDLPSANVDRVKKQLQDRDLTPEDWGGETIVCEVSALKKQGVDRLLDNMLVLAEIMELKATNTGFSKGAVIEAQLEQGRGPTATVLVQSGTFKIGSAFICGDHWGKVKSMFDDRGQPIKEASPSTPVKVLGFAGVPNAGDSLLEMKSEREARQYAEEQQEKKRLNKLEAKRPVTLENLFETLADQQRKVLKVLLKGDVQGSIEAIATALLGIKSEKVSLEIVHKAVGPVTESDVLLASASKTIIIGFNTRTETQAAAASKREAVQIKLYSIIYELIDQVKEAMAGLLDPVNRESVIGTAAVKQVISLSKYPVAGCSVQSGRIARSGRARVLRGRIHIYDGAIQTLKRFQDDVSEVRQGLECGIRLGDFNDYQQGDLIECYQLEKMPQQL